MHSTLAIAALETPFREIVTFTKQLDCIPLAQILKKDDLYPVFSHEIIPLLSQFLLSNFLPSFFLSPVKSKYSSMS